MRFKGPFGRVIIISSDFKNCVFLKLYRCLIKHVKKFFFFLSIKCFDNISI